MACFRPRAEFQASYLNDFFQGRQHIRHPLITNPAQASEAMRLQRQRTAPQILCLGQSA